MRAAVLVLVACGASSTAIDERPPAPQAQPAPLPCISTAAGTRITHAVADGRRVRYCIADTDQCFVIDPDVADIRAFARVEKPPLEPPAGAYVETTQPRIEVCTQAAGCTSLTTEVLPTAAEIRAATTRDGAFAAFLFGGGTANGRVEIWDVPRGKKLATFRFGNGDFQCGDVAMLGGTVLVTTSRCGTAESRGALYSLHGKKLADVGGKDFDLLAHAEVDATTAAFLDERGKRLAIHDLARGKLVAVIDTSAVFLIGGAQEGSPGESALVRLADGRLAVIAGAPAVGSVATVDPKTRVVGLRQAPVCAK